MRVLIAICCLAALAFGAETSQIQDDSRVSTQLNPSKPSKNYCTTQTCIYECLVSGYETGTCKGKVCVCSETFYNLIDASTDLLPGSSDQADVKPTKSPKNSCITTMCIYECVAKGRKSGSCKSNVCVCSEKFYDFTDESTDLQLGFSDKTVSTQLKQSKPYKNYCTTQMCIYECLVSGHDSGYCKGNVCECTKKFYDLTEASTDLLPGSSDETGNEVTLSEKCKHDECNKKCKGKKGKIGGFCSLGICNCYPKTI